jgi:hypothetical protein
VLENCEGKYRNGDNSVVDPDPGLNNCFAGKLFGRIMIYK